jgi:hypothetical protein
MYLRNVGNIVIVHNCEVSQPKNARRNYCESPKSVKFKLVEIMNGGLKVMPSEVNNMTEVRNFQFGCNVSPVKY